MKHYEIEQKYRCRDLAATRKKILIAGGRLLKKGSEHNELWDQRGALEKKHTVLRLRRHGNSAELTLKGPRLESRYSKRIELESAVQYAPVKAILKTLGYKIVRHYSKQREVYKMGQAMVTLDVLPRYGKFIEIEGSPQMIFRLAKRLGLVDRDREERSYLQMLFGKKG